MADPAAALATQLKNIEARTGQSLTQLQALVASSGLTKVGEQRSWLMERLSLGYGDANTVVLLAKQAAAPPTPADPLEAIYAGAKAPLRPLHDALMARIHGLGPFEIAPKQKTLSLRRKKQFAVLGPATMNKIELGLNARDLPADPRLKVMPAGGMCAYTVRLGDVTEIDATLMGWIRTAYDASA